MAKQQITAASGASPAGAYSQGIRAGDFVFVSGQGPLDPATGKVVGDTIEEQTERVIANLAAVLQAAGGSLADVVKTTVFMTDLGEFAKMNAVYAKHFTSDPLPARAAVQVAALPRGARVEVEAVARL